MKKHPDEINRPLEELLTLYLLNPTIRDVFVEGPTDQAFIRDFLLRKGIQGTVKTPEVVKIGSAELISIKLPPTSNRSKLVYLGAYLAERGVRTTSALCIVDRDLENYCTCGVKSALVAFTDFSSMEMYFFNERTLSRFMKVSLRLADIDVKGFIDRMANMLCSLFFLRVICKNRGWFVDELPVDKYVDWDGESLCFSLDQYVLRFLMKNDQATLLEYTLTEIGKLRSQYSGDWRAAIWGHDYTNLLYRFCCSRKGKNNPYACPDGVTSALYLASSHEDLESFELFQRLITFTGA